MLIPPKIILPGFLPIDNFLYIGYNNFMGRITAIEPQKNNKNRVNLYIDGEFYAGLDTFTAEKHRLKTGAEADAAKLAEVTFDSECASAFEKAMGKINARMRSEYEIRVYLAEKAYPEAVIESAVEKLKHYRYIDDAEFCRLWIGSRRARSGILKIRFELKTLGIEAEIIEEAFSGFPAQTEEAYRLAVKYRKSKEWDKRKAFAYLMQKGFESDTIKAALEAVEEDGV